MTDTPILRTLLADRVIAYAMALDARDWTGFRALFEDEIEVDYGSLGSLHATVDAQVWTDRCRVLGGFDATHHKISNIVVETAGIGQSDTEIVDLVDLPLYVMTSEYGAASLPSSHPAECKHPKWQGGGEK